MNAELAAETEAVRFTTVRLREGYAMPDVDAFLDRVVARLRSAQLPGSRLKEGYAKREVDPLLGRLEERLAAGRTFDDLLDAGRSRQRFGDDVAATDELLTSVRYAARYA